VLPTAIPAWAGETAPGVQADPGVLAGDFVVCNDALTGARIALDGHPFGFYAESPSGKDPRRGNQPVHGRKSGRGED